MTALDRVTKAQDSLADSARRADEEAKKQVGTLEQMRQARIREKKALDDSATALRGTAAERRKEAELARRSLEALQKQARLETALATEREKRDIEEVTRLRRQVAERQASAEEKTKEYNETTRQIRQQANLLSAVANQEAAANRRRAAETNLQIAGRAQAVREAQREATVVEQSVNRQARSSRGLGTEIRSLERDIKNLGGTQDNATRSGGRVRGVLRDLGLESRSARSGVSGLNSEFQGFQVALFIKYIQSIITAVVALAGQMVAVAAAAAQAGAALVGAFAAGAAQAIPVIGVLAAALFRVKNVLQAVKLSNQQQLTATQDATTAAQRQRSAAEQVANAQRQVADAHREVSHAIEQAARANSNASRQEQRAQEEVTRARRDAIRTVQDLIDAEKQAQLSVEGAQASLRQAVQSGDVAAVAQAQLGLQEARTGRTRAGQDLARQRTPDRVDAVVQAERSLADARRQSARTQVDSAHSVADAQRQERRAEQDLNQTRRDTADSLKQETAAADKLADTLKRLSPAERELYQRILRLQDVYRRAARPITDIITRAFTGVVDATISKLQDPRIITGFRNIAVQVAGAIRSATREATGPASTSAFQILSAEAARNIPIATRILIDFFRVARNLVLDAIPAFRLLLRYVEGYAQQALEASRNSRGLRDFFVTGVRYANSFFQLGLAIVRLFLAIAGRGGAAAEGQRTIDGLTRSVDGITARVLANSGAVRRFFRQTGDVLGDVLRVVGAIGLALLSSFNPRSVKAFADFMIDVIIPAITNVVEILGFLVNTFHQLASLPGVSTILQLAATVLILGKGLTVISEAISSVRAILPAMLAEMGLLAESADVAAISFGALDLTLGGAIVVALIAIVAAVVLLDNKFHFLGPTFKWLKGIAEDVFNALRGAGESVLRWLSDVWTQGLLYWIRWPFVKLFELVPWDRVFGAISTAARAVVDFFTGGNKAGAWGALYDSIALPFRASVGAIRLVFRIIKDIIVLALDVIAGRFDDAGQHIKDLFNGVLDTLAGAATSFLGIWQGILDALGHVRGFGWAKGAADAIKSLRREMDKWRESLRGSSDENKSSNKVAQDSLPTLKKLHDRYEDANDSLRHLTPGTDAYRSAARKAKNASDDYNDALRDTAKRAGLAQEPVGTLRRNIALLATVTEGTARSVAEDVNEVLKNLGAKQIKINIRHRSAAQQITGSDNPLLASPFGRAGGGILNPYASAADNHLVLSPGGMPVAAFSGSEGIVNTPQMGVINTSLAMTNAMGMMPWGSLDELWGSGMRHYQTGGGLQPAIRQLSNRLDRQFGLTTISGYRTSQPLGHPDYHNLGLAADISGTPQAMARASRYIMSSGIWHSLLEGIHNPGLSIKNGQRVAPGFWGSQWSQHIDHIHIALSKMVGAIGAAFGRLRAPRFTGTSGPLLDIARASARRMTTAANRYLGRAAATSGGADARAQGAEADVVAAFRRAIGAMHANRPERLALWEAGIVESGLRNLHFGDADSLGALQERASIYGRAHALNPFASAIRFLTQAKALRPWRGSPGMLAAAVQRPRADLRGRYDQVSGRAMRYLQGGGPIGTTGAARAVRRVRSPLSSIVELLGDVNDALGGFTSRQLRRVKDLGKRIRGAFEKLTEDGGLLDQMSTAVEDIATRAQTRLQRRQFRVGRGGPRRVYQTPAELAQAQLGTLQLQRTGLTAEQTSIETGLADAHRALHEAQRRKDKRAAAQARAAIANLRQRLEKNRADLAQNAQDQVQTQESFQQALVDQVNNTAERQGAQLDRLTRLANLGGTTNYAALGGVLRQRQTVLTTQRAGLQGLLAAAQRTGNVDLAKSLADQISELTTQLAENTQAIKDNTDAAFNARTQEIQQRASFTTGIFGSIQNFFQALTQGTGADTSAQQALARQGIGTALATQQGGLKSQLASLLGYTPQEASRLQGLTGGDLVSFIGSIASGPAFDAIMSRLDPTQQAAFQDLLSALVDNATATEQNTEAINQASQAQSFSSSFWTSFREAIFTGAGQLLPQYQTYVPTAQAGARIVSSGMLMTHAGETVRPASVARDWQRDGGGGGDTYNLNVSTPTEVLNPIDVGRQLAFYRKTQSR